MKRWKQIRAEIVRIEALVVPLQRELMEIRSSCLHPNLPKHAIGDEFMDTCPDCGHISYC